MLSEYAPEDLERFDTVWPPDEPMSPDIADAAAETQGEAAVSMYLALGERERALELLEVGVDRWTDRVPPDLLFKDGRAWFPPALDPVRDDPWFRAILEEFGVADLELRRLPTEGE